MTDLSRRLSDEEQAQFYDTVEYELSTSVRDLVNTISRMDRVQNADKEHFTMPMDCLYELSGIISQAIVNHSNALSGTHLDQTPLVI
jgi:hypothetical protein